METMNKKKKIILLVSIITLIILFIISSTIAYFGWSTSEEEEASISVTILGGNGECTFVSDNNIDLEPTETKEEGRIIKFKARQELAASLPIVWNMSVRRIGGLQHESFKYEFINSTTGVSYGSGNFKDVTTGSGGDLITFSNGSEELEINKEYEFTLYLWIDASLGNPSTMSGETLDFDMNCQLETLPGIEGKEVLSTFITNLYLEEEPTLITQPSTNKTYYYASSVKLMNDGLDNTGAATNSMTEGNIRYYGNTPNNYIYFNCDDYNNQSANTCERWRIVGVFDGKTKIVREESIGDYSWDFSGIDSSDQNVEGYYESRWEEANLNKLLNVSYYNNEDNIPYVSFDYPYTNTNIYTTINFKTDKKGLKNDTTRNLISENLWYLGGYGTAALYGEDVYIHERGNATCENCNFDTTWTGKIGLMYGSDFLFATDLSICGENGEMYYKSSDCYGTNWMFTGKEEWLLGIDTRLTYAAYAIREGAYFGRNNVRIPNEIRPSVYLNADVELGTIGTGTFLNPYQISLNTE